MSSKEDYFSDSDNSSGSDSERSYEAEEVNPVEDNVHVGGSIEDIESDNEEIKSIDEVDDENITNVSKNIIDKEAEFDMIPHNSAIDSNINLDEDSDDYDTDENYLQKFSYQLNNNYIQEFHPECAQHNYEEIKQLSKVVRNSNNIIIDPFHKTQPFLTKYEKTRILGQRSKQIESGATPFINVPETVIDSYIIAKLELSEKKIPFIIKRPISNGSFEYWNIKDLEIIDF